MTTLKSKLLMRLPAILLLAGSVLFWTNYDRYRPVGPVLLSEPQLTDACRVTGDCTETNGIFRLSVSQAGRKARVDFDVSDVLNKNSALIRVRGKIRVEGVVKGKYSWHAARMLFVQYDHHNRWIPGDHGLISESGTKGWVAHEDIFETFPGARKALVNIQQAGIAGTAWFSALEAQAVELKGSFLWWRAGFAGLWLLAAVRYFRQCRLDHRKLRGLVLLNAVLIIVGTLMPSDVIEAGAEITKEQVEHFCRPTPVEKAAPGAVQKKPALQQEATKPPSVHSLRMDRFTERVTSVHALGHFLLFASLCFLVYLSAALERQHPIYFVKVGFDILLFAAISEALQFLTIDRTPGLSDMMIDVYGMATALVVFLCILPLVHRFRPGTQAES